MKARIRTLLLLLICFLLLAVAACVAPRDLRSLDELEELSKKTQSYVIKRNDVLDIQVWGEQKLSGQVAVRDDGKMTFPLLNDVQGEGKTLVQLARDLEKKLEDFISGPQVTVSVAQEAPIRYFLSGAFNKPGEFASKGKISLLQAIATGGGFAPFANQGSVMLIRRSSEGDFRYKLDYKEVVNGYEPNPYLQDGDVLSVE